MKEKEENETSLVSEIRKKNTKAFKCFECGKPGHFKKDCRVFKQRNNSANVVKKTKKNKRDVLLCTSAMTSSGATRDEWIIDSGATQHMCNTKSNFSEINYFEKPMNVQVGDGNCLYAVASGKIKLVMKLSSEETECTLEKVLFVPKLCYNLISISKITENGARAKFFDNKCEISRGDKTVIGEGVKNGNLYHLKCNTPKVNISKYCGNSEYLWHQSYGHLGFDNLRKLNGKKLVSGMSYEQKGNPPFCHECCQGKSHKLPFLKKVSKEKVRPFQLIHSDVCGKITPTSLGGGKYFLTFIDEATHYVWVYILKTKDEVFEKFKEWKRMVENEFSTRVKRLRTDNG